jgi:hypothetical protein
LPKGQSFDTPCSKEKTSINGNWDSYKIFGNESNNALADINLRLSKPCGNYKKDYNKRVVPINELYTDPDQCDYRAQDGKTKTHPLYYEAGFTVQEYDTYQQNKILDSILDALPSGVYSQADLRKNDYNMYYKPFSTLKQSCQSTYST